MYWSLIKKNVNSIHFSKITSRHPGSNLNSTSLKVDSLGATSLNSVLSYQINNSYTNSCASSQVTMMSSISQPSNLNSFLSEEFSEFISGNNLQ